MDLSVLIGRQREPSGRQRILTLGYIGTVILSRRILPPGSLLHSPDQIRSEAIKLIQFLAELESIGFGLEAGRCVQNKVLHTGVCDEIANCMFGGEYCCEPNVSW